jgi:signal transduction histidine kinase
MHFARPSAPKLQVISVRSLIREVADSLQSLAQQRKVKLIASEMDHDEDIQADLAQVRTAVSGLLRNAIEAAPADGWAGVRTEKRAQGSIDLIVEDNGNGPCPTIREHLFDPFFSGRSAGRGRGLGLPIAWRLAQQQGGDVCFDGIHSGVTRFILSLPVAATSANANANGYHTETVISQ